jgi:hypothetical protein
MTTLRVRLGRSGTRQNPASAPLKLQKAAA